METFCELIDMLKECMSYSYSLIQFPDYQVKKFHMIQVNTFPIVSTQVERVW